MKKNVACIQKLFNFSGKYMSLQQGQLQSADVIMLSMQQCYNIPQHMYYYILVALIGSHECVYFIRSFFNYACMVEEIWFIVFLLITSVNYHITSNVWREEMYGRVTYIQEVSLHIVIDRLKLYFQRKNRIDI